jgi:hypothetical protein
MRVLDKLVKDLAEGDETRLAAFEALVLRVADGEDVTGLEAQPILAAAGKHGSDLAAAVRRIERRRELARLLEAGAEADLDLAEVRQLHATADRELCVARQRHGEVVARLRARAAQATDIVKRAKEAERELLATAPADLRQKSDALARQRDQLAARRRQVAGELRELDDKTERFKAKWAGARTADYEAELAGAQSRREQLSRDIEIARAAEETAAEEAALVKQAMLAA